MQPPTVLVFDDDAAIRDVISETLRDEGYPVRLFADFSDLCGGLAQQDGPTVVLADFWGQSFATLSPAERAEVAWLAQQAPTILATGRGWARVESSEALGLQALLPKPFDLDVLLQAVGDCQRTRTRRGDAVGSNNGSFGPGVRSEPLRLS